MRKVSGATRQQWRESSHVVVPSTSVRRNCVDHSVPVYRAVVTIPKPGSRIRLKASRRHGALSLLA